MVAKTAKREEKSELEKLIEEKSEVVLGRLRTNSSADEALKYSQAFVNLTHGRNNLFPPEQDTLNQTSSSE